MKQFAFDEYKDTVSNLRELSKEQLHLAILGQLQAITPSSLSNILKNPPSLYICRGLRVCWQTFYFIYSVSEKKLTALKNHLNFEDVTK